MFQSFRLYPEFTYIEKPAGARFVGCVITMADNDDFDEVVGFYRVLWFLSRRDGKRKALSLGGKRVWRVRSVLQYPCFNKKGVTFYR